MNDKEILRLGAGSAHGWDNLEAALELANSGKCDYLIFDCLSEKVALLYARQRRENRASGWDPHLESRMRQTIPACASTQTKMVTNVGASNPAGAAVRIKELCTEVGAPHLKVLAVVGDNVFDLIRELDPIVEETGQPVSAFGDKFVAASAYCPVRPLVEALDQGADIVVSGRAGDSTQYLAPMVHKFGWAGDDFERMAKGLGIGHLMECAAQITGGYFADPPHKIVPDLHRVGFPIAYVEASGDAEITKLPGTGGVINRMTAIEQVIYEIGDPANYKHNDAIVDFTTTNITEVGPDRVRITETSGHPKPPTIKVCLGVHEGYFGFGQTSYAGDTAYERAKLAADVVSGRMSIKGFDVSKLRFDFIGVNAIFPWKGEVPIPKEVRLRVAGVFPTWKEAETLYGVVGELPCNGPTGSTWGRDADGGGVEEITGMYTTLVPQEMIQPEVVDVSQMAETSSG